MDTPRARLAVVPILALGLILLILLWRMALPETGFYHDDWCLLEHVADGRTLWGAVKIFANWGLRRPLFVLLDPLAYTLAAGRPTLAPWILLCAEALEGVLLFMCLRRLNVQRPAALAATVFTMLYPGRPVIHVWLSNGVQLYAHDFLLLGFLFHLRWMTEGGWGRLVVGQALYLSSILCYESTAFLPLFLLTAAAGTRGARPWGDRGSWAWSMKRMAPFAVTLAAAVWWLQWAAPRLLHTMSKPPDVSFAHVFRVFSVGLECITNRVVHACWKALGPAWSGLEAWQWALLLGIACICACALEQAASRGDTEERGVLWLGAAGLFFGSYLPYALSGGYVPTLQGIMSRTNGSGAWCFGMLAAGVWAGWPRRWLRARAPLTAGAAAALLMVSGVFHRDWGRSWVEQKRILREVSTLAEGLPGPATIVMTGPTQAGQAVIFDAPYDFNSALRLTTGRKDLRGAIASWRFHFEAERAVERPGPAVEQEYSYERMYLFNTVTRDFRRLTGPPPAAWLFSPETNRRGGP